MSPELKEKILFSALDSKSGKPIMSTMLLYAHGDSEAFLEMTRLMEELIEHTVLLLTHKVTPTKGANDP